MPQSGQNDHPQKSKYHFATQAVRGSERHWDTSEYSYSVTRLCPASMNHAIMSPAERATAGIPGNLVRLSIGLEDADDLIADLDQAFAAIQK